MIVLALLTGCGSGGSSNSNSGPLSGNWQITMQPVRSLNPIFQSGFLLQQSNNLAGSLVASDACAGATPVTGTISGSNVTLNVNEFGGALNMTGSISSDNAGMSGSYLITEGSCHESASGTWVAVLVHPVRGAFHGAMTSSTTPLVGNVYNVSGTLTQGQNDGSSNTDLTGVLNAVNYPCFSTVNIRGTISGQNVLLSLYDPLSGSKVGTVPGQPQSFAMLSPDATTLSATSSTGYGVSTCPGLGPLTAGGDAGQITLTFP
jgi:hypothetical protein